MEGLSFVWFLLLLRVDFMILRFKIPVKRSYPLDVFLRNRGLTFQRCLIYISCPYSTLIIHLMYLLNPEPTRIIIEFEDDKKVAGMDKKRCKNKSSIDK